MFQTEPTSIFTFECLWYFWREFHFLSKVENILKSSKLTWIFQDDIYSDEDYRKIFTVCPSLRVLCYCIFEAWADFPKSDVYFFDTINQKVVPILQHAPYLTRGDKHYYCPMVQTIDDKSSLYTFAKPRIARYTVDWLKF